MQGDVLYSGTGEVIRPAPTTDATKESYCSAAAVSSRRARTVLPSSIRFDARAG